MQITDLRCEYTTNPLGIDTRTPRFSWKLEDSRRGQSQTAYQVLVASSLDTLSQDEGDRWDSGRVASSAQVSVEYAGAPLASTERCFWKVRAWDCEGQATAWSEPAWFEMGLLDESDWTAMWFGFPAGLNGSALYFRSFFAISKPVKKARAYVAGLGLYEFYVNGTKATDHVLEPAQTEYDKRVFYTTVDIGPLLKEGWNAVGAIVGNGWYPFPKLRMQVHIEFEDGTRLLQHTARTATEPAVWSVTSGPIVSMMAIGQGLRLAWRAGLAKYDTDEAFDHLLRFVRDHAGVLDEVALFESITHHLYIPLDEYAKRTALVRERMGALKAAGAKSVGINVLATLGHINEAWDSMPVLPFQPMVGHDGSLSTGCACPNTPELRSYIRAKYRLVAEAQPDFVWVDDDIRMHHHGVAYACFCPTCLAHFSDLLKEHGHVESFTRESLVQALDDPARGDLRQAWVEQNIRSIEGLLAEVAEVVHDVNPAIATGLMTAGPGWSTYSGQAFHRWLPALRATKGRPGGGFYSDANRLGMIDKAYEVGRQRAGYPAQITDCQYELENFPQQALSKSVSTVMHECTLALAVGHNGVAFNALGMWEGSLSEYGPIAEQVRHMRPVWEGLVEYSDGLPTVGLWPAWNTQVTARRTLQPGQSWFAADRRYDFAQTGILAQTGLPLSVDDPLAQERPATILYGRVADAFSDGELCAMLAGGCLMDSTALEVLHERGLGHLAGARIARRLDNGAMERFTSDPLNGPYAGQVRDARIEFWGDAQGMADVLEPVAQDVRVLATMEDYFRRPVGACMTAYENELGGRVVVMGYAQWMYLHSIAKRSQLINVADWVTRGMLPVRIDEPVALTPFVRMSPDRRRGVVVVLNYGLDAVERATLHVRAAQAPVVQLTPAGEQPVAVQAEQGGWLIELAAVQPWTTVCLAWKG